MRVENPFDGDASSFDAARALLEIAIEEVMRRRGGFAALRVPRVEVVLRRAIDPTLRDALLAGRDGEVLDLTIDGHAVPRRARRRTRSDLALLVWRSVILGGAVIWAWDRHPNRPALVLIVTLGEILVVAEYTRLRAASRRRSASDPSASPPSRPDRASHTFARRPFASARDVVSDVRPRRS